MALKIEILSRKSNAYELYVKIAIKDLQDCEDISVYQSNLQYAIKRIPRKSNATAANCYSLIKSADWKTLSVWHVNSIGDKDRLVATITQIKTKP
jgi:hypothetical protein